MSSVKVVNYPGFDRQSQKGLGIEENPYLVEDTFWKITNCPIIVGLDPLRIGAHKRVMEWLLELGPDQIILVFCEPENIQCRWQR